MGLRLELQTLLEEALGSGNVYFQPPATLKMKYPALVYERTAENAQYADNTKFNRRFAYQVTVIDRNPDSPVVERVTDLPLCSYNAHFVVDGLNHDVFRLFF